ncbi:MAG: IclR family transcriptional regulator [Desulfobacterales bacterium]
MPASGEKYFFVGSLAKGMRIMELLAEHKHLTVSGVARLMDTNRAAGHRFLATLRELGYVEKDEDDRYRLTFKVFELGMQVANRFEIRQLARPMMQELALASGETVNLGHFGGRNILHLDRVDSLEILRMDVPIGSRAPAYCTALGKAVLAYRPAEEFERYLARVTLKAHGPNTITRRKLFRQAIAVIREKGYAVDDEEMSAGLRCVAAPVIDHTGRAAYAISVSGPSLRMTPRRIAEISPLVLKICRRLSQKLGSTALESPQPNRAAGRDPV